MVEDIEEVSVESQSGPFRDLEGLFHSEIGVEERRANQRVAFHLAKRGSLAPQAHVDRCRAGNRISSLTPVQHSPLGRIQSASPRLNAAVSGVPNVSGADVIRAVIELAVLVTIYPAVVDGVVR